MPKALLELLGYGWHVNLQKPICNDLADATRMLDAAKASGRLLRVMDNYLFYEPLMKLKEISHLRRARRSERVPHEDGGERPWRLGRPGEHLRVAVPADATWPWNSGFRRRLAQALDCDLAVRPHQGSTGVGGHDRGHSRYRGRRRPRP